MKVNQPEASCSSRHSSLEVECGVSKHTDSQDRSPDSNADVVGMHNPDAEERYPADTTSNHDDCSTSATHQYDISKVLQRNRSQGIGERNKRKRWRGRHEKHDFVPLVLSGNRKLELKATTAITSSNISEEQQVLAH